MNYYLSVLKKYAVFSGRAQRAEYWYFILFNLLIALALGVLAAAIPKASAIFNWLLVIYYLAMLIPSIAVTVRRLHDCGRSGWLFLISLIPFVGVVLFIFMLLDSEPGQNKYGPNPKGVMAA